MANLVLSLPTNTSSKVHITSRLDEVTLRFEEELRRLQPEVDLPLVQTHAYLEASRQEFRLFQFRNAEGQPAFQLAMLIHRSKRLPSICRGVVSRLGTTVDSDELSYALRSLRSYCSTVPGLITVRVQPYRSGSEALAQFEALGLRAGFSTCKPNDYTHTLMFDLSPSLEALPAALSKKTRKRFKLKNPEEISVRALNDSRYIPMCKEAMRASFARTGSSAGAFDFEAAFELARRYPDRLRIAGFFINERPDQLLAFSIGFYGGGRTAEYNAAGSLPDSALRKFSFNYFLIWDLIEWAHKSGAKWFDLGGVTSGGFGDHRASISEFKRHFSENEIEAGREMIAILRPWQARLFNALTWLSSLFLRG